MNQDEVRTRKRDLDSKFVEILHSIKGGKASKLPEEERVKKDLAELVKKYKNSVRDIVTTEKNLKKRAKGHTNFIERRIEQNDRETNDTIQSFLLRILHTGCPEGLNNIESLQTVLLQMIELERNELILEDQFLTSLSDQIHSLKDIILAIIQNQGLSQQEQQKITLVLNTFAQFEKKYKGAPLRNVAKALVNSCKLKRKIENHYNKSYITYFEECETSNSVCLLESSLTLLTNYKEGKYTKTISKENRFAYRYGIIEIILRHIVRRYLKINANSPVSLPSFSQNKMFVKIPSEEIENKAEEKEECMDIEGDISEKETFSVGTMSMENPEERELTQLYLSPELLTEEYCTRIQNHFDDKIQQYDDSNHSFIQDYVHELTQTQNINFGCQNHNNLFQNSQNTSSIF
jgi:hypothetical protein